MTDLQVGTAVEDLPPSCKLVSLVVDEAGPLTQAELVERTRLPARTARWALDRLREEGVVAERWNPADARSHLYEISGSGEDC